MFDSIQRVRFRVGQQLVRLGHEVIRVLLSALFCLILDSGLRFVQFMIWSLSALSFILVRVSFSDLAGLLSGQQESTSGLRLGLTVVLVRVRFVIR
ncbi:hypothetical protein Hdeb2414_s0007g00233401 [Helianthus debilis subsp. tardiflorus]